MAAEVRLPSIQLFVLENMHYSHMIRFDNVEEARRLQLKIDKLKQSKVEELGAKHIATDSYSETDTEGDDHCPGSMSNAYLEVMSKSNSNRSASLAASGELSDDLPLISLIRPNKRSPKTKTPHIGKYNISIEADETFLKSLSKSTSN